MLQVNSIDHIVLTVKDIETSVTFYTSVLGMKMKMFGQERVALFFGNQKINLHKTGEEVSPHAQQPVSGSADICLLTNTPLEIAMKEVESHHVKILKGPVKRSGARGEMYSFYIRDPDGNLIEIANSLTPK